MTISFVTVAVPIAPGTDAVVRDAVQHLGNPATAVMREQIEALGFVHFMSITVISAEHLSHGHLLIELSVDGSVETALRKLGEGLGEPLNRIFEAAKVARYTPADLAGFLLRHNLVIATSWTSSLRVGRVVGMPFSGLPGMTVSRVKQEEELTRRIVATGMLHGKGTGLEKLRRIRSAIWADGDMKWAFQALDTPFLRPVKRETARIKAEIFIAALVPLLWPLLLVPLAAWFLGLALGLAAPVGVALLVTTLIWLLLGFLASLLLTQAEAADIPDDIAPAPADVAKVMETENAGPLNLLVTVSRMKPGWLRQLALRGVFRFIQEGISRHGIPGFLGKNGEIGTLHSGRWIVLPGTDLLVFVAHYDGSWLSYMQDFVDLVPQAPTAIWTNTRGFPRTQRLFEGGARDSDRVTRWFHRQQVPVDFWYAASPGLTLGRIRANAEIRQGFARAETDCEAEAWLALFGAPLPAIRDALPSQTGEIPTLVFGALKHLCYAACLVLTLDCDPDVCRRWLARLAPRISYGRAPKVPPEPVHVLAVAATGLRRLGVDDADVNTFPAAFVNGMASAGQARVLGDKPEKWGWGNVESPADAVLLIYACSREQLEQSIQDLLGLPAIRQHVRIDCQVRARGKAIEPFGFRDGLSQPVIPGTPAFERNPPPDQIVAPGEFVLGFKDSRGYYPPVPTVAVACNASRRLQYLSDGRADIGSNSSFLVVRQLRQNVPVFEEYVAERARTSGTHPDYIKAKMMGRWQNGSSLVRNPHKPGDGPDNDFRFGKDDPDGLACPRGAHVRRANPRDGLHADPDIAVQIVNRRRILRVGRPYVDAPGGAPQGILFMCLNADIERQYALVQQAWLRNANFDGLRDEADPLIGQADGTRSFTIPTAHGPLCLNELPDFVTVVGGGYFWLPSASAIDFLTRLSARACKPLGGDQAAAPVSL